MASKVAKIVADASPELVDEVKLFFINLFQSSAEYVSHDFLCPAFDTVFDGLTLFPFFHSRDARESEFT